MGAPVGLSGGLLLDTGEQLHRADPPPFWVQSWGLPEVVEWCGGRSQSETPQGPGSAAPDETAVSH